nr:MAG TPA: hypothetical protein [Caudoviricetes sp.]
MIFNFSLLIFNLNSGAAALAACCRPSAVPAPIAHYFQLIIHNHFRLSQSSRFSQLSQL